MTRLLAVLGLCSAAAVGYGCWLAWPPLGFIVSGLGGLAFSLFYDTGSDRKDSQ